MVARNVRAARKRREWSGARLAEECAKLGYPQITAEVIGNIERGRRDEHGRRRRDVTVDELVALSEVLEIAPDELLAGPPSPEEFRIFTPEELATMPARMRRAAEAIRSIEEGAKVMQEYFELLGPERVKVRLEEARKLREARDDG